MKETELSVGVKVLLTSEIVEKSWSVPVQVRCSASLLGCKLSHCYFSWVWHFQKATQVIILQILVNVYTLSVLISIEPVQCSLSPWYFSLSLSLSLLNSDTLSFESVPMCVVWLLSSHTGYSMLELTFPSHSSLHWSWIWSWLWAYRHYVS